MQMRDSKGRFCKVQSKTFWVTGWKALDPDFKCRNKRYDENRSFAEPEAELCTTGMHFCVHPADVFNYYDIFDSETGRFNTYASVYGEIDEAQFYSQHGIDSKMCTKRLSILSKYKFYDFVEILSRTNPDIASSYDGQIHKVINKKVTYTRAPNITVTNCIAQVVAHSSNIDIVCDYCWVYSTKIKAVVSLNHKHSSVRIAGKYGTKILSNGIIIGEIDNRKYFEDTWYSLCGGKSLQECSSIGILAENGAN